VSEKRAPGSRSSVRQDGVIVLGARSVLYLLLFFVLFLPLIAVVSSPLIASSVVTPVAQESNGRLEAEIKAAFLYHFGAYVDWPPGTFSSSTEPLVIGVTNAEIFDPLVEIVRVRTIRNRPLSVKRVRSVSDTAGVHMLYVSDEVDPDSATAILRSVHDRPVLTVTDSGYEGEAILTFVLDQDRVRFDVALSLAEASDLRVSARLLSVARRVEEGSR
jgi:hypothetical protein